MAMFGILHKSLDWAANVTSVAVLTCLLLLNTVGAVKGEENWTIYEDETSRVIVRYENEENKMIVTLPENFLPTISEVVIKYEIENNKIIYDNRLLLGVDHAYSLESFPSERIDSGFGWIEPGAGTPYGPATHNVWVDTSSPVVVIKTDPVARVLYFSVAGPTGTQGDLILKVTKNLISSPENVKGYLDNGEIDLNIEEDEYYYQIKAEYTHSAHVLSIHLGPRPTSTAWYTQPLNLALIGLAVVIALGVLYWLKFRR